MIPQDKTPCTLPEPRAGISSRPHTSVPKSQAVNRPMTPAHHFVHCRRTHLVMTARYRLFVITTEQPSRIQARIFRQHRREILTPRQIAGKYRQTGSSSVGGYVRSHHAAISHPISGEISSFPSSWLRKPTSCLPVAFFRSCVIKSSLNQNSYDIFSSFTMFEPAVLIPVACVRQSVSAVIAPYRRMMTAFASENGARHSQRWTIAASLKFSSRAAAAVDSVQTAHPSSVPTDKTFLLT